MSDIPTAIGLSKAPGRVGPLYQNHPLVQKFYHDFREAAYQLLKQEGDAAPYSLSLYWVAELKKLAHSHLPYEGSDFFLRRLPQFAERFNVLGQTVAEAVSQEKHQFIEKLLDEKQANGIACYVSCDYVFEFGGAVLKELASALDQALDQEAATGQELSFEQKERLGQLEEDKPGVAGSKSMLEYDNGSQCRLCRGEVYSPEWADCSSREKHHKWRTELEHGLTVSGWRNSIRLHWDATGQYQPGQNALAQADYDWRNAYAKRAAQIRAKRERVAREAREKRQAELNAFYTQLDAKVAEMKFKWGWLELERANGGNNNTIATTSTLTQPEAVTVASTEAEAVGDSKDKTADKGKNEGSNNSSGNSSTIKYKVKLYGPNGLFGVRSIKSGRFTWIHLTHMPTKLRVDYWLGREASLQDCLRLIYLMLNMPGVDMNFTSPEDVSPQAKELVMKLAQLIQKRQLPSEVDLAAVSLLLL